MNQDSRQSIVELLFLSLYLDDKLTMAEDDTLDAALDALGWDSQLPRDKFLTYAYESARAASADAILTDSFLDTRADVITRGGAEAEALTWLSRILGSDGLTDAEKRFLDRLQARLYPGS